MSKETKDIPPIPTISGTPRPAPPSFIPKKSGKEKLPNGTELPYLAFVCLSCNIRVTIQPVIVPISFNQVFCPICRTLYMYAGDETRGHKYGPIAIDELQHLPVGTIKRIIAQGQKINNRHDAIDLLYQMRYTCQCVGPEPENGWCKHCKRLLQDE